MGVKPDGLAFWPGERRPSAIVFAPDDRQLLATPHS